MLLLFYLPDTATTVLYTLFPTRRSSDLHRLVAAVQVRFGPRSSRAGVPRSGNDTPVRAEPAGAIEVVREDDGRRRPVEDAGEIKSRYRLICLRRLGVRRTRIGRPGAGRA